MRFSCTKCGKCCRGQVEVKFLPEDFDNLCRFLNIDRSELFSRYDVESVEDKLYIIHDDEKCPFILEDNLCEIQSIKPLFCSLYIPVIESPDTWTYQRCDGVGIGEEVSDEKIDCINTELCRHFNFKLGGDY